MIYFSAFIDVSLNLNVRTNCFTDRHLLRRDGDAFLPAAKFQFLSKASTTTLLPTQHQRHHLPLYISKGVLSRG
jgi:hypothetical protein